MWAQIELAKEATTPPGSHPLWKSPQSDDYVSIEEAAAGELRLRGFFTSQNGRRLFELIALMAGLPQGLNAKRLRKLWMFGIHDEALHDILVNRRLDAFPSNDKSQLARCDLENKISISQPSNPTYFQYFCQFLQEANIHKWETQSERSTKIAEAIRRFEISREGARVLLETEFYFAPDTSKAHSFEEINWPYSGRDVEQAISNLRKEDVEKYLQRALKYVASELISLPERSDTATRKPTFEDALRFFFWKGCNLDHATRAVMELIEVTGAQLIYEYVRADQRYIAENHSRAGFPDLLVWNGQDVHFVDVKGPGDRLQDSQKAYSEAVLRTIGYSIEVCRISPLSPATISVTEQTQPWKNRNDAALSTDQQIRSSDKKALKKKYKYSAPEDLLLKTYYKEATAAAREIGITVAVEILDLARVYADEHRIPFDKDKYVQYLHASGWRGDYRSLLWEMTLADIKKNQNASIGNYIAEASQMNFSLGKVYKKQDDASKHLLAGIRWSAFGLLSVHYSNFSDKLNWMSVRDHPIFVDDRTEAEIDEQHIQRVKTNIEFYKSKIQRPLNTANKDFPVGLYVKFLNEDICSNQNLTWLSAQAKDESERRHSQQTANPTIARNSAIFKDALRVMSEVEMVCEKFKAFVCRYGAHTN